jgi:hypothetical protein
MTAPRLAISRRSLLVGFSASVGALVARMAGRSPAALADYGDPLILGQENSASSKTELHADLPGTSSTTLQVENTGLSGTAIVAEADGTGIRATGITGVDGASTSPNGSGVLGADLTSSPVGRGVAGFSHNGWGVYAVSGGQALRVDGRATFSRSGEVTITSPDSRATVSGVPLSTSSSFPERPSLILATCQSEVPGVWVAAVVPDPPNSSFEIVLNRAPGSAAKPASVIVAWFVVN